MTTTISSRGLWDITDTALESSMQHRFARHNVTVGNIVNANTPGFRALGYDFEQQLQAAIGTNDSFVMKTSDPRHIKNPGVSASGQVKGDLHVKPTESIGNDGNTVDVDREMADLATNQILYSATLELLNRRFAMMRYGINGGR